MIAQLYYLINNIRRPQKRAGQSEPPAEAQQDTCPLSETRTYRDPDLEFVALSVEDFKITKELGLVFDLGAVADDDDLHVGGIEIFAGGGQ